MNIFILMGTLLIFSLSFYLIERRIVKNTKSSKKVKARPKDPYFAVKKVWIDGIICIMDDYRKKYPDKTGENFDPDEFNKYFCELKMRN